MELTTSNFVYKDVNGYQTALENLWPLLQTRINFIPCMGKYPYAQ